MSESSDRIERSYSSTVSKRSETSEKPPTINVASFSTVSILRFPLFFIRKYSVSRRVEIGLETLCDFENVMDESTHIPHFIVVPRENFDERAVGDARHGEVSYRAVGSSEDVARYERLVAHGKDTLPSICSRSLP